ncbi:MAG: terminase family protein [Elusimicrobiaceae bacterium]|uniref:terminase large subunit domain-containing protein n=1 Tax=Candidatus Avelusimicrobium faecicola TaxID=3416205 RepID=UPI002A7A667A|nr:terminase family protein [Spirochaetota bacterium]MDY2939427.1 terminase family protein [Elusimicrobiaceae bacterium]
MPSLLIPYTPRFPQTEIHPQLESHRFCVLVTHRQMGKTVCAVNHLLKQACMLNLPNGRYFYVAPFLKQAEMLVWDYFKRFTAPLAAMPTASGQIKNLLQINEAKLSLRLPNGAVVRVLGADNPDAMRGTYAEGIVLDEYAQIKPNVFNEIIRPMLTSRKGWCVFLGTPKGQDQFYDVYCHAAKEFAANPHGEWWAGMYRADQTGIIAQDELARIQTETPENLFRQEYLCDFTASRTDVLIPIDLVLAAQKRFYNEYELRGAPKILGVDPARFGDDRSVIIRRQGLQAFAPRVLAKLDNVQLAGLVAQEIKDFRPDAVFVDAGQGAGVIDVLRSLGYEVTEVPFGGAPLQAGRYRNKRAELWGEMAEWIRHGGALPEQETTLANELASAVYDFDEAGKMRLEAKDKIKARLGKSPDLADALALTFAAPVASREQRSIWEQKTTYEVEWSV